MYVLCIPKLSNRAITQLDKEIALIFYVVVVKIHGNNLSFLCALKFTTL